MYPAHVAIVRASLRGLWLARLGGSLRLPRQREPLGPPRRHAAGIPQDRGATTTVATTRRAPGPFTSALAGASHAKGVALTNRARAAILAWMRRALVLALAFASACSADQASTTETTTDASSSSETSETTAGSTSSETTAPTTAGTTTDETTGTSSPGTTVDPDPTGFEPPDAVCGNGFLEEGEQCDDGNDVDEDDCSNACLVPCGLEWTALEPAPTLDSEISGLRVVRDGAGNTLVAAHLQEITVDEEENVIEGPDTILVIKYDPEGGQLWQQVLSDGDGDTNVGGLAVDELGDVAIVGTVDGADGTDIWATWLDGQDGSSAWTHTHDGDFDGDDYGMGVAIGPDGDPIISGQVRDGDKDDDVFIRKLDAMTGFEVWTSTWSGQPDNGYSVDAGGPVAVASDGAPYVIAEEYVSFNTVEATLIRFAADGSGPEATLSPLADGEVHKHAAGYIAADGAGHVYFTIERFGAAPKFWLYKIDDTQTILWERDRDDFQDGEDDWYHYGIAVTEDDELVVGGRRINEIQLEDLSWWEAWTSRLSADGDPICALVLVGPTEGLSPADLLVQAVGAASDGGALLTGAQALEGESMLWTARFRP